MLTVRDPAATARFYQQLLGLAPRRQAHGRLSLCDAAHKLNLHRAGDEVALVAAAPQPGTADFCVRTQRTTTSVVHPV